MKNNNYSILTVSASIFSIALSGSYAIADTNIAISSSLSVEGLNNAYAEKPAASGNQIGVDIVDRQLIVLFDPYSDEFKADEIVQSVRSNNPADPVLAELGHPEQADYAIHTHLPDEFISKFDPYSPKALLREYVILTYPEHSNIDAIMQGLANRPDVLSIEKNYRLEFAITPDDPHLGLPGGAPDESQWGIYALNLPAAWEYTTGHAYLGVPDNGIHSAHDDLKQNYRPHFSWDVIDNDNDPEEEVVNGISGHGTHVAGIIAATTNNGMGTSGVCWRCSLMVVRTDSAYTHLADSVDFLVNSGAQAINLSFTIHDETLPACADTGSDYRLLCKEIEDAVDADILIAAASGNYNQQAGTGKESIGLPAANNNVLAIGGITTDKTFWKELILNGPDYWGSSYGSEQFLVAPARSVLSTFYPGGLWNPGHCADSNATQDDDGYAKCTGTSMAAPHVTALIGLIRSVNPLLSRDEVKEILMSTAIRPGGGLENEYGYGYPDAENAVKHALHPVNGPILSNRLTPLFGFYSSDAEDHFYTTVPQMAVASLGGTLLPQPPTVHVGYTPADGTETPDYDYFPISQFSPLPVPLASVYIFTTEHNPVDPSIDLKPLYRLSYQGGTSTNPDDLDHFYTTSQYMVDVYVDAGYKVDGIEGYIFPRDLPQQPEGTVRLYRKYNPQLNDHAIFPQDEYQDKENEGYTVTVGDDWIGYVYPNVDTDQDGLIDGFEIIAGTCRDVWDTDGDSISDGAELLNYPYTDPGKCPVNPNPAPDYSFLVPIINLILN